MKKVTIILTLLVFTSFAFGQVIDEGFETWPPAGWTLNPIDGTGAWVQNDGTSHGPGSAFEGDFAAMFSNYDYSSGIAGSMTTNAFDASSYSSTVLSFYWWNNDGSYNPATLSIYSSANGVDFDLIETIETYQSSGWKLYETGFSNEVTHIRLTATSDWGVNNTFIDSFVIDEAPSCLPPTGLTAGNITTNSAELSWTENGTATAWNIELVESGVTPTGNPTFSSVTNPFTVDELSSATSYSFYVQADCGTKELSTWVGPYTFTTACAAVTVPYAENFDGDWVGNPAAPVCWTVINADNDNYKWSRASTYISPTHSTPYAAHGMGNNDDYLITPAIDLSDVNARLIWWDKVESATRNNSYLVLVSTTNAEITSFVDELGDFDCTNTTWLSHELDLSAYNGQTIYIAFYQYYSAATNYGFGIDDVLIEEIPSCLAPTNLTATEITTESALLGWTENGTATAWNIELGESGFTPTETPTYSGVTNPFYVEGLSPAMSYDFYVQTDCGTKELSIWVGPYTFTTLCEAFAIPFTENFDGVATPEIPNCWRTIVETTSLYPYVKTSTVSANSAPNSVVFYNSSDLSSELILVSPEITDALNTLQLSFYADGGVGQSVLVGTMTDPTNSATFTEFTSIIIPDGFVKYDVNLSSYAGSDNYVALKHANASTYHTFYIDDITVDLAPETGTLSGIVTSAITGNPIEGVTVNASLIETIATTNALGEYELLLIPGMYTVTFSKTGFEPVEFTDVEIIADVTTTLDAALVQPVFSSFPFVETFEDDSPSRADWSQIQESGAALWTYAAGSSGGVITTAYEGLLNARFVSTSGNLTPVTKLVTPLLDMSSLTNPRVIFWYGQEKWVSDQNETKVYYRISDVDPWVELAHFTDNITEWTRVELALPNPSATYQLAFEGLNDFGRANVLDFVTIEETPPPGILSGIVTDFNNGSPLEGVSVTAEPGGFTTLTDPAGEYELELQGGLYTVTFDRFDYFEATVEDVEIVSTQTTTLSLNLLPIPAPGCSELNFPDNDAENILPEGMTFEWSVPLDPTPVDGYLFSLYDFAIDDWVLLDEDLGNVTSYTTDLSRGTLYGWQIKPYNFVGINGDCVPYFFTTSYFGTLEGIVTDAETGLPIEGATVVAYETEPNEGNTWEFTTDVDGMWSLEWEAGFYDIQVWKYGYLLETTGGVEIEADDVALLETALVPVIPYTLPFVEDWENPGEQLWYVTGDNWGIAENMGNPGNAAIFYWNPQNIYYQQDLYSYYIDARNETEVYAQFDLLLSNYDYTFETLSFMIYDGVQWNIIETFDNYFGDIPWTTLTYDISDYAAGKQIYLGFRAEGEDTYSIDWWLVDNILVSNTIMDVDPDALSEVLFFNEIKTNSFDILNLGNGTLDWTAEISPAASWASLNLESGNLTPGGAQTLEVTFDAATVSAGVYTTDILITESTGMFSKTISLEIKVYEDAGQQIMIPPAKQWGYISTYINMNAKASMSEVMADIDDDMVITISKDGIYWPEFAINSIGEFNPYEGYKMKMKNTTSLAFFGDPLDDKTVTLGAGTHILPVLSTEPVDAATIFNGLPVEYAYGLDGSLYWPTGGISTLETLYPGFGYLVRLTAEATFDFAQTKSTSPNTPHLVNNTTTWNDVYKTSDFHLVGIAAEATDMLEKGDVIGIFNSNGLCAGMMDYTGNNEALAIPVFVDDMTTREIDGMLDYEPLHIRIYRDNAEFETEPVYSTKMPNHDGLFATNGLSMVTSLKAGSTSIADDPMSGISIYPNPSDGVFNIKGLNEASEMMVTNAQGQVIMNHKINDSHQLDLGGQPNGIYFIRLLSAQGVKLVKVIKQ